jgi:hypothetical protein
VTLKQGRSGQIDNHAQHLMPIELHTDGVRTGGENAIGTGGLSSALTAGGISDHKAAGLQIFDDVADGLGGKLRGAREFGPRERAVDPECVEDDTSIVGTGAVLVGPRDGADFTQHRERLLRFHRIRTLTARAILCRIY